jgi:hypothetical protein
MQVTDKQRKLIWAGAAFIAVCYFAPSIITRARQAAAPQEPVMAKPSPVHVAPQLPPQPPPDPAAIKAAATAAEFNKLTGDWSGGATLAQGICRLSLQLRPITDKPGQYSAYSTMQCNPALVLLRERVPKEQRDILIARSMTPTSAILSGTPAGGKLAFQIEEAIGTPWDGCVWKALNISPFADQIAAQWQDSCRGGQMVLNRVSNVR